mmetsp:Transcript_17669/g.57771  ORF Transcript_17669/g.57771 Transcript_17669/m.57771 type:complete len:232 (+) Transcript_17669:1975-2670(+)
MSTGVFAAAASSAAASPSSRIGASAACARRDTASAASRGASEAERVASGTSADAPGASRLASRKSARATSSKRKTECRCSRRGCLASAAKSGKSSCEKLARAACFTSGSAKMPTGSVRCWSTAFFRPSRMALGSSPSASRCSMREKMSVLYTVGAKAEPCAMSVSRSAKSPACAASCSSGCSASLHARWNRAIAARHSSGLVSISAGSASHTARASSSAALRRFTGPASAQ